MGKKKKYENVITRSILLFVLSIYSIFLILLIPEFYKFGGIKFILIVLAAVLSIILGLTIGRDLKTHRR